MTIKTRMKIKIKIIKKLKKNKKKMMIIRGVLQMMEVAEIMIIKQEHKFKQMIERKTV